MKTIHVVEVNDAKKPLFPQSCVVCARAEGERLANMIMSDEHGRVDLYFYGLSREPARGSLLEIPVHESCAKAARNDLLRRLVLIIFVAAAIVTLGVVNKYGVMICAVAAVLVITPLLYFQFTKPVPVEFNRYGQKYVLMFKEREYAEHFARLNGAEVRECKHPYTGIAFYQ